MQWCMADHIQHLRTLATHLLEHFLFDVFCVQSVTKIYLNHCYLPIKLVSFGTAFGTTSIFLVTTNNLYLNHNLEKYGCAPGHHFPKQYVKESPRKQGFCFVLGPLCVKIQSVIIESQYAYCDARSRRYGFRFWRTACSCRQ